MDVKAATSSSALPGTGPVERVGTYTREELAARISAFHGTAAPGVVIGCIMIDLAMQQLPEGILFDAICETADCLPDAVQLITPCTIGNKWLKIINLGRFAVSLYDKYSGQGVRVFLDPCKLQGWDELRCWFLKIKPKHDQDSDLLHTQIWAAGRDIYTLHPVQIDACYLKKQSKGPVGICAQCGEAYPLKDGATCLWCQGHTHYTTPALS